MDIKPERMANDNKQDTAILKPKEIKEVKEDISDGMDDFFWEDEPKKDISAVIAKPAGPEAMKEIDQPVKQKAEKIPTCLQETNMDEKKPELEQTKNIPYMDTDFNKKEQPLQKKDNDTVTDKSIDDEPLWDIDDDVFSPGTVDKINESEKTVLTIKENIKEERKIHIAPVKNKEVHANEDSHAKYPLQNKEDDFIFGHEESLVWNDDEDMGLEEQDDKTSKTQEKPFQSHDNSSTSSTSKQVQSKPDDVIKKSTDEIEKENTERFRFDKLGNDTDF